MIKSYPRKKDIYATECHVCKAYVVYDEDETFYSSTYYRNVLICPRCKSINMHTANNVIE